jgi:hypothetical protein
MRALHFFPLLKSLAASDLAGQTGRVSVQELASGGDRRLTALDQKLQKLGL